MNRKRVFITGGANGIGACLVRGFFNAGYQVAFCDIDAERGEELRGSVSAGLMFFHVDVTDVFALEAAMNQLFRQWGDIDVLINNVGKSGFRPLTEMPVDDFDQIIRTNLRSAFVTSRCWAIHRSKDCKKKEYGRIINISSTRYLQSEAHSEAYAASKGGIVSLTHALAMSLSGYNITVNCLSPGWIQVSGYDALSDRDHGQHPSGRVGKAEDILNACLFLCEENNNFINGQNIVIDGGMTKKMIYEE